MSLLQIGGDAASGEAVGEGIIAEQQDGKNQLKGSHGYDHCAEINRT